jgi:hypothetical protein
MESTHTFITIVSGYPRSGTSLMMQMLEAGGLPVLRDEKYRPADERNPRGYYEIKAALKLGAEGQTTDWVAGAQGKAVKVIAYQLRFLPPEFTYRVVFMRRRIAEILASSGEFKLPGSEIKLLRADSPLSEREKILAYKTEYVIYEAWLMKQKHLPALFVNYNDLIDNPAAPVARLRDFLGLPLDADAMLAAIDPALYRNRAQG